MANKFLETIKHREKEKRRAIWIDQTIRNTVDLEQDKEALLLWAQTQSSYEGKPDDIIIQSICRMPERLITAFFVGDALKHNITPIGEPLKEHVQNIAKERNLSPKFITEVMTRLFLDAYT